MSSGNLPQHESGNAPAPADQRRRSLIKGGLGAAPVIMTLSSRSAFAWHCKSPSGFVSGNKSHPTVADEGTLSPFSWTNMSSWPAPFNKSNGKWPAFYGGTFDGHQFVAGTINYQAAGKPTVTIHDVMASGAAAGPRGGNLALGAYILAALLNLKKGTVPSVCLTEDMLFKMFNDCASRGYYLPMPTNPTVRWSAQSVIDYLVQNWLVG
jgi:hypothetical protein